MWDFGSVLHVLQSFKLFTRLKCWLPNSFGGIFLHLTVLGILLFEICRILTCETWKRSSFCENQDAQLHNRKHC